MISNQQSIREKSSTMIGRAFAVNNMKFMLAIAAIALAVAIVGETSSIQTAQAALITDFNGNYGEYDEEAGVCRPVYPTCDSKCK